MRFSKTKTGLTSFWYGASLCNVLDCQASIVYSTPRYEGKLGSKFLLTTPHIVPYRKKRVSKQRSRDRKSRTCRAVHSYFTRVWSKRMMSDPMTQFNAVKLDSMSFWEKSEQVSFLRRNETRENSGQTRQSRNPARFQTVVSGVRGSLGSRLSRDCPTRWNKRLSFL